jgi:hypothetical protein
MRIVLLFGSLVVSALCLAQTAPVITISFDGHFNGVTAAGPLAGTPEGKPEFAPGKFGQALKSGPPTGYVNYPADLLQREAGTVEMWVCPLDWTPAEEFFHVFFDVHGEGALYLYKYYQGTNLLMLSCAQGNGPYAESRARLNWQPGEWHHIAGTWSVDGVRVYVDGQSPMPVPMRGDLPIKLGSTFRLGDHPWHIARTTSSLIDEVRIYDRALSPAHIAAHARGDFNFVAPLTARDAMFSYELDSVKGEVAAHFGTGGADVPDEQLRVKLGIVPKGQPLGNAPELKVVGGRTVGKLPLDVSRPAQLEVVAQVFQQGTQAFELRRALTVPDIAAWKGNKLGREDKVLPPWTPVGVQGLKASVWDREYDFDRSTDVVQQIKSGCHNLLAGPVRLRTGEAKHLVLPFDVKVNAAGTRAVVTNKPDAWPKMTATVEYDGLAWFELSGLPRRPLDSLTLDIPLRPEIAMYRHRYDRGWDTTKFTGLLPEGQGVIDSDKFIPFYWIGNNDRGLFWFCESDEFWPNGQSPDAVQVIRGEDGTVTLRLNILAKGQKLPDNWKLAFGLQATPVKPLPKDWRKWRLQPARAAQSAIIWPRPTADSLKYYGYPEAADPALFKQRMDNLHTQGIKAVPYLGLSFLSAACPEWPFFRKQWSMGSEDTGSSDVAAYGAGFAMVSPIGPDYSDFIVWKTNEFIKQYDLDGLYHDNTHPYGATTLASGCGYVRDGKVYPTYPIMGYRDLYRRMYAVLKSYPKETYSIAHMSGKVTIPILAYEDAYLDGEHFRGRVGDNYLDLMSLDTFRTEYMGRQWGVMPVFLAQLYGDLKTQVEPTRGLMALLMLHDVAIWDVYNVEVVNEALAALDEFGFVEADFIGYFDNPAPAATDMKDVYVSAYRQGGRTLLIVGNVGREDRQGSVTLSAPYFGGKLPAKAQDWPAKTPLTMTGGKLSLSVEKLGYRLVVVE